MAEFRTPVDIASKTLQALGQRPLDPVRGFNDGSLGASEISAVYGKLRQAEYNRNAWRFTIKRAVLRAIDANTMVLQPALFSPIVNYYRGSLVIDQNNNVWRSAIQNNLGNDPLTSTTWQPYFGPLTAALYDSSQSYYAGEAVYTAAGDGTYNVYSSLVTGNAVHPALPNDWAVQTTYAQTQVVRRFAAWLSGTTYAAGNGVTYTDGNTYVSLVAGNLNHVPPSSPNQWALLPTLALATQQVPVTTNPAALAPTASPVIEWASGTTYALGNAVMFAGAEWVSLQANNTGNYPNVAGSTFWVQVAGGTIFYMSLIDLNIGNDPLTTFVAAWAGSTTYASGNQVTGSDGLIYTSQTNGNVGINPVTDNGTHWVTAGKVSPWSTSFNQGDGNPQWLQIGGKAFAGGVALTTPNIGYPVASGPSTLEAARNIFRLPANYLRKAPRDPKAGSQSPLGAPAGLIYDDWELEGDFIVSRETGPLVFRFGADVTDVTLMTSMFCEGLALRIAWETCERITQSSARKEGLGRDYHNLMTEARQVNAIEVGSEEPAMDDWLACRY